MACYSSDPFFHTVIRVRGYGIVNCNPRCTYCPLVPKLDNFDVTDGSPMADASASIKNY